MSIVMLNRLFAQLQLVRVGAVLGVEHEHVASAANGIYFRTS